MSIDNLSRHWKDLPVQTVREVLRAKECE
jgi:hypothetical protein